MNIKSIDIIVAHREGTATEPGQIYAAPPKEEVEGREKDKWRYIECPNCGAVSVAYCDQDRYYVCPHCTFHFF